MIWSCSDFKSPDDIHLFTWPYSTEKILHHSTTLHYYYNHYFWGYYWKRYLKLYCHVDPHIILIWKELQHSNTCYCHFNEHAWFDSLLKESKVTNLIFWTECHFLISGKSIKWKVVKDCNTTISIIHTSCYKSNIISKIIDGLFLVQFVHFYEFRYFYFRL